MKTEILLPLLDIVFLSMGAVLAFMTQMERVPALDIELARVGSGAAVVQHGDFVAVSVTETEIYVDGRSVARENLAGQVSGRRCVLRAGRQVNTQRTLEVLSDLIRAGSDVALQVDDRRLSAGS
jgi:biopolymer transport protein ExbD